MIEPLSSKTTVCRSVEASVKRTLSAPGITTMVFSVAYFLESTGLTRAQSSTTDME